MILDLSPSVDVTLFMQDAVVNVDLLSSKVICYFWNVFSWSKFQRGLFPFQL